MSYTFMLPLEGKKKVKFFYLIMHIESTHQYICHKFSQQFWGTCGADSLFILKYHHICECDAIPTVNNNLRVNQFQNQCFLLWKQRTEQIDTGIIFICQNVLPCKIDEIASVKSVINKTAGQYFLVRYTHGCDTQQVKLPK